MELSIIKLGAVLSAAWLMSFSLMQAQTMQIGASQQQAIKGDDAGNRYTRVWVSGEAIVNAQPDTAIITVGVVTQEATALAAQQSNATKTDGVIRAAKQAAGENAEIKTSNYSLSPQYVYKPNETPRISSYQASNSVMVTLRDLRKVGAVIDAASEAGANNINGIAFTLRNDTAAREQALKDATRAGVAKAKTLAEALGGRFVRIVEVREASVSRPPIRPLNSGLMARASIANAPTPIETGSLEIRSEVELIAEVDTER